MAKRLHRLGIMGYPMAGYLQAKGHDVCVDNRTAAKAEAWARQHGGRTAATRRAAAEGAELVFMRVGNDDDIRSVAHGEDGALAGLGSGCVLVDQTTASADIARELEAAARDQGKQFLDDGSRVVRRAPRMHADHHVRGEQAAFERAKPATEAFARAVTPMARPAPGSSPRWSTTASLIPSRGSPRDRLRHARRPRHEKVIVVISRGRRSPGRWATAPRPWSRVVRFRLSGHVDAQGSQDLHGGGEPQRRAPAGRSP